MYVSEYKCCYIVIAKHNKELYLNALTSLAQSGTRHMEKVHAVLHCFHMWSNDIMLCVNPNVDHWGGEPSYIFKDVKDEQSYRIKD